MLVVLILTRRIHAFEHPAIGIHQASCCFCTPTPVYRNSSGGWIAVNLVEVTDANHSNRFDVDATETPWADSVGSTTN
jgi:hypothetical protein